MLTSRNFRVPGALCFGLAVIVLAALAPPAAAEFPGRNGRIAFNRPVPEGGQAIFTIRRNGTGLKRLPRGAGSEVGAAWSANGKRLAVVCGKRNWDGTDSICTKRADGSRHRRITFSKKYPDRDPEWAPGGRRIVFARWLWDEETEDDTSDRWEIFTVGADGKGLKRLTHSAGSDYYPNWSPDGSKILFNSSRDDDRTALWVMNRDGSKQRNLTGDSGLQCYDGDWSPDGKRIVAECWDDESDDLYVLNADGSGLAPLGGKSLPYATAPKWSPNGRRILFVDMPKGHGAVGLFTVKLDGSDRRKIYSGIWGSYSPSWQSATK